MGGLALPRINLLAAVIALVVFQFQLDDKNHCRLFPCHLSSPLSYEPFCIIGRDLVKWTVNNYVLSKTNTL